MSLSSKNLQQLNCQKLRSKYREGSETDYDSIKSRQPSVASVNFEEKKKDAQKLALSSSSSSSASSSSSKFSVSAQPVYSNTADPVYANAEKIQKSRPPSASAQSPSSLPSTTTWNVKEERNTWEREVSTMDGLRHQDNVDGRQEQRKTTPAKRGTLYSSSDSDTSSSEEEEDEIFAASRTEVEDDNSGDREVKFNLKISSISSNFHFNLTLIL